ncbi:MAG: DUF2905 domain-containing protein [Bacteroidota bacterium]
MTEKALIITGICFIVLGIFWNDLAKLSWLGNWHRLPGDIFIERENFRLYIPLTTSILFSAILSLVCWILQKR